MYLWCKLKAQTEKGLYSHIWFGQTRPILELEAPEYMGVYRHMCNHICGLDSTARKVVIGGRDRREEAKLSRRVVVTPTGSPRSAARLRR